jgi:hypothetical protein
MPDFYKRVLLMYWVGITERYHGYDSVMQHEQDVTNEGGQTSRFDTDRKFDSAGGRRRGPRVGVCVVGSGR